MKCFKMMIVLGLLILVLGCDESQRDNPQFQAGFTGCEMKAGCKLGVKEKLYVSVLSGEHREDFGILGAGKKRDLGATISYVRFRLDIPFKIIWGVDGEDDYNMTHSQEIDLSAYIPYSDQIKSVTVMYHKDGKWRFTAYDAPGYSQNKKEIIPDGNDKASDQSVDVE